MLGFQTRRSELDSEISESCQPEARARYSESVAAALASGLARQPGRALAAGRAATATECRGRGPVARAAWAQAWPGPRRRPGSLRAPVPAP